MLIFESERASRLGGGGGVRYQLAASALSMRRLGEKRECRRAGVKFRIYIYVLEFIYHHA